jgi:nucleotide-binding universal stress UspA family protein
MDDPASTSLPAERLDLTSDAVLPSQLLSSKVLRGPVEPGLRSLVGVMNHPRIGAAACERHLQRVDDQLLAHVVGHAPADDPPRERVLDSRQVQPALPGPQIAEVSDPQDIGRLGAELALHEIISDPSRRALAPTTRSGQGGSSQALERIDKLGGVDAHVEYGEPASELRRYGRSVDLLVLGSHKHSPIGRLLGQGTAQRLADEPPCPLLVVGRD